MKSERRDVIAAERRASRGVGSVLRLRLGSLVRCACAIENMRQSAVVEIELIAQAELLHNPTRRAVIGARERDNTPQTNRCCGGQRVLSKPSRDALAPPFAGDGPPDLDFATAIDHVVLHDGATDTDALIECKGHAESVGSPMRDLLHDDRFAFLQTERTRPTGWPQPSGDLRVRQQPVQRERITQTHGSKGNHLVKATRCESTRSAPRNGIPRMHAISPVWMRSR